MYFIAGRMGCLHLLVLSQVEELLGPAKCLVHQFLRYPMVDDVHEANISTCGHELVSYNCPFSSRTLLVVPRTEIDYWNRRSHDNNAVRRCCFLLHPNSKCFFKSPLMTSSLHYTTKAIGSISHLLFTRESLIVRTLDTRGCTTAAQMPR